jgi:hypothetical protein
MIRRDGLVLEGGIHPAATHLRQLTQRAEALLARYLLAATGREVARPRDDERDEVDKWQSGHDFYGERTAMTATRDRRRSSLTG